MGINKVNMDTVDNISDCLKHRKDELLAYALSLGLNAKKSHNKNQICDLILRFKDMAINDQPAMDECMDLTKDEVMVTAMGMGLEPSHRMTKEAICEQIVNVVEGEPIMTSRSPSPIRQPLRSPSPIRQPLRSSICDEWFVDPFVNPRTGRKIKKDGPAYKKLERECGSHGSPHRRSPSPRPSPHRMVHTEAALVVKKKAELMDIAKALGLRPKQAMTKAILVDLILGKAQVKVQPATSNLDLATLTKLKKNELLELAYQLNIKVPKAALKATLIEALLNNRPGVVPALDECMSLTKDEVMVTAMGMGLEPSYRMTKKAICEQIINAVDAGPLNFPEEDEPLSDPHFVPLEPPSESSIDSTINEIEKEGIQDVAIEATLTRDDEFAMLERQAERLGYEVVDVPRDGDCFFHVLGSVLRIPARVLRTFLMRYIRRNSEHFKEMFWDSLKNRIQQQRADQGLGELDEDSMDQAVDRLWANELDAHERMGCFADEHIMSAAVEAFKINLKVLTASVHNSVFYSFGGEEYPQRPLYIGYIQNYHYTNLKRVGEPLLYLSITQDIEVEIQRLMEPQRPPSPRPIRQPSMPSLRPSIPPSIKPKPLIPSVPQSLQPSINRLNDLRNIINNLQPSITYKLSTLSNLDLQIQRCVGLA